MKNCLTTQSSLFRRLLIILAVGLQLLYASSTLANPAEVSSANPQADKTAEQISTAAAWTDFTDQIKAMGDIVQQSDVPNNDIDIAEGYRYLLGMLAEHIEVALYRSDLNDPLLRENISKFRNAAMPSSDGYYTSAQVDDQGTYRLWGKLGSAKGNISFQFYSSVMGQSSGDLRDFVDAEGHFDIQIGGKPKKKNWAPLPKDAQMIYIREYFSDWNNEHRSDYFFDRLDRKPGANPLSPKQLTQILQSVTATYTKQVPYWKTRMVEIRQQLTNKLAPPKKLDDVGIGANL